MKILFVAVFDRLGRSSNTSQATGLANLGHEVFCYNYRTRLSDLKSHRARDVDLINCLRNISPDLTIFAKCNEMNNYCLEYAAQIGKVCYWFPDSLSAFLSRVEYLEKCMISDYFCCDKKNVQTIGLKYNKNSFVIEDGYDPQLEFKHDVAKDLDVSFIGSIYGDRLEKINAIQNKVSIFSNAFGSEHSKIVSRSKINLNFCTSEGASDRVYKILAAGGFLLTDDWEGRQENYNDGEDLVIFKSIEDLNNKISYYLKEENQNEREKIGLRGMSKNQKFSRYQWANKIIKNSVNLS